MDERYSEWLRRAVPTEATWRTKLSELRRVEATYGDLDAQYDRDELSGLLDELNYTAEDARNARANPSRLDITGDLRNNLASYKSAVQKYARFRQDVEIEAARPALLGQVSIEDAVAEDSERTFTMEKDLQAALRASIAQLEPGLTVIDGGAEKIVSSGRIDILARDSAGTVVVIELKTVKAPRDAVAQVLAYMGDLHDDVQGRVRGILIAPDFDPKAVAAARVVPGLKLVRYGFSFTFRDHS
jgi:endonuclease